MDETKHQKRVWHKILDRDELAEGRVKSVSCGGVTLFVARHGGEYGALDNACPHQGGALGEGSIENGLLRCPWHGWDFDPITGKAPGFENGVATQVLGLPGPSLVELVTDTELI